MRYWLSRYKGTGADGIAVHPYLLSPDKPHRSTYPIGLRRWVGWSSSHGCAGWVEVPAEAWHLMGGTRLQPGTGPIQIDLTVTSRLRRQKVKG